MWGQAAVVGNLSFLPFKIKQEGLLVEALKLKELLLLLLSSQSWHSGSTWRSIWTATSSSASTRCATSPRSSGEVAPGCAAPSTSTRWSATSTRCWPTARAWGQCWSPLWAWPFTCSAFWRELCPVCRSYYEDWAFVLDEERASMLPTMAAGERVDVWRRKPSRRMPQPQTREALGFLRSRETWNFWMFRERSRLGQQQAPPTSWSHHRIDQWSPDLVVPPLSGSNTQVNINCGRG